MRGINQFTIQKSNLDESPGLSYLLGVLEGDASLYKTKSKKNREGSDFILQLAATDKDFVEFFNDILKKILFRKAKIIEYYLDNSHFYRVNLRVREFYNWYFTKEKEELYKIAQFSPNYFVKGVFDSEGSLTLYKKKYKNKVYSYPVVRIVNSNLELLSLINKWLWDYYEIKSSIVKRKTNETYINGRKCKFRKEIYCLSIHSREGVKLFFEKIGTSIKRKKIGG